MRKIIWYITEAWKIAFGCRHKEFEKISHGKRKCMKCGKEQWLFNQPANEDEASLVWRDMSI